MAFLRAVGNYLNVLLFDFTFQNYISLQIIPLCYLLVIFGTAAGLGYGVTLVFMYDVRWGLLALILAPVLFLVLVSLCRVVLELLMVVFRMAGQLDQVAFMRESVDKLSEVTVLTRPLARLFKPSSVRERDNNNNQRR